MPENQNMKANVLMVVGVVLLLVGGIGARVGTTNLGLFIVYLMLALAGVITIGLGRKLRDRKYE